jgi:hypothetical protein
VNPGEPKIGTWVTKRVFVPSTCGPERREPRRGQVSPEPQRRPFGKVPHVAL